MSIANIRSLFESHISDSFGALTPAVPVMFDNVQDTPPAGEHVVLTVSFPSFTEPTLCMTESGVEYIRGNVQIACYTPRGQGMKRLEVLAETAIIALNNIQDQTDTNNVRPRVGQILGPINVLTGREPLALTNVSAPFVAKG